MALDLVQTAILAVSTGLLVPLLIWTAWPTLLAIGDRARLRLKSIGDRLGKTGLRIFDALLAIIFTTAVLLPTIFVRELLFAGKLSADIALGTLFAVSTSLLVYSIVSNLPVRKGSRKFRIPPWISIVAAIVAVGFILAPDITPLRDWCLNLFKALNLLDVSGVQDSGARKVWEDANTIIGLTLASLSAGTAAVTGTSAVVKRLGEIRDNSQLTDWQKKAAKKLRYPAESAIGKPIVDQYPREIRIEAFSPQRIFPFETVGEKRARIKIVLADGTLSTQRLDLERILELVHSARIDLESSIFLVYSHNKVGKQDTDIICYGTGRELRDISDQAKVGGGVVDDFYRGINDGDREILKRAVESAREHLVKRQPQESPLLSATTHYTSSELMAVLHTMAEKNLDRILLRSESAPFEQAIIGAAEIGRFLYEKL